MKESKFFKEIPRMNNFEKVCSTQFDFESIEMFENDEMDME